MFVFIMPRLKSLLTPRLHRLESTVVSSGEKVCRKNRRLLHQISFKNQSRKSKLKRTFQTNVDV